MWPEVRNHGPPLLSLRTDNAALPASIQALSFDPSPWAEQNAISCNTHLNVLLQLQKRLPDRRVWNTHLSVNINVHSLTPLHYFFKTLQLLISLIILDKQKAACWWVAIASWHISYIYTWGLWRHRNTVCFPSGGMSSQVRKIKRFQTSRITMENQCNCPKSQSGFQRIT